MYAPDYWKIVSILGRDGEPILKVFATWRGGYVNGDSWRLNSGITKVEADDDKLLLHGYSGSVYSVLDYDHCYRTTGYTGSVLGEYKQQLGDMMKELTYDEAIAALKEMM